MIPLTGLCFFRCNISGSQVPTQDGLGPILVCEPHSEGTGTRRDVSRCMFLGRARLALGLPLVEMARQRRIRTIEKARGQCLKRGVIFVGAEEVTTNQDSEED